MMPRNSSKQQSGLTLIELMIALVLGLLLVAGVIQIFVSNKHSYRVTEAHSRLQDNARFALEVLSKDIRSAGYSGCRAIENMNVVTVANIPIPASMNANTIITGINNWAAGVSPTLGEVVPGTDVITLQGGRGCGATLTGNVDNTGAQVHVFSPNTCNLVAGDAVMIADCEDAHIFRASTVSNTPAPSGAAQQNISHGINTNRATHFCKSYNPSLYSGNCAAGDDNKLYGYDSELLKFVAETYFIRLSKNGDPALWKFDLTAPVDDGPDNTIDDDDINPTLVIEGIENMQIEYGVDTNDDDIVDDYRDAQVVSAANAGAGEWDKVVSARISLLAQTLDQNLTTAAQNVTYNGNAVTGEGRIRRVFTTTIGVRNRVQ